MVTKEAIEHVAKLMKIELENEEQYIERVQKMMQYFDLLDDAPIEGQELAVNEKDFEDLRNDEYKEYPIRLIDQLKRYKENYIRAPKMN